MKLRIVWAVLVVAFFAACENPKTDAEIQRLQEENQMLQESLLQKDSAFSDYFSTLNEIESNLETIKLREKIISKDASKTERSADAKERITEDLQMISDLMEQNRTLIERLNRNLRNSNVRISELDQMVERLTRQLEEKEIEIAQLRSQLDEMNIIVGTLTTEIDTLRRHSRKQDEIITQKISELNTAYYAFGTRKELIAENIISRTGGFLGIGKTNKVAGNLNTSYFTKIDITKTKEITISGKKPKLVTSHPADSYTLTGQGNLYKLVISDYNKFWSASRHLVIEIE